MLKRILVPLDSSRFTDAATRMAIHMTESVPSERSRDLSITGLSIVDLDQVPSGRMAGVVDRDQIVREAEQACSQILETFRGAMSAGGVPAERSEALQVSGSPFREIIRASVFADVVVMGENCSFPPVNYDYDTLHHLYHHVSRPLILTDEGFRPVERVVLAMDGTAPASRTMFHYVHLNPFPGAELVLAYSHQEEEEHHLQEYFVRVEEYLRTFGFSPRVVRLDGPLESGISACVTAEGAQLLAIGVHREHFLERIRDPLMLREPLVRRLLRNMQASLFLVH